MKNLKIYIVSILTIIGLGLLFHEQIISFIVDRRVEVTQSSIANAKANIGEFDYSGVRTLSQIELARMNMNKDNDKIIGLVAVPELGINQPIINELTNYSLSTGAAVYYKDMIMGKGNYVLASHFSYLSESNLFSPLYYNLSQGVKGQSIYVTDLEYLYTYKAREYKVVDNSNTWYIRNESSVNQITLFTCNYDDKSGKVILSGELVSKEKITDMNQIKTIFGGNIK